MFDWHYPAPRRFALSLLLIGIAAVLLIPAPPSSNPITWDDLISPLRVGLPITRGFVLSEPRRGEDHDVVFVARRPTGPDGLPAVAEIHITARGHGPGYRETPSFDVSWEQAPPGSSFVTSPEDMTAIRDALADALARNDHDLPAIESVPLTSEPAAPWISRLLDRLLGFRGIVIATVVAIAIALLGSIPHGTVVVGVLLFALGLGLRGPSLDLPFIHDQDVQRVFTGHLALQEIATGAGLMDRHPPLYFFVLHYAQRFGQAEAVVRAPAVVAGALVGPAVLMATAAMCGEVGSLAALVALVVTLSPELIAYSREVSEIPLFALIVMAAAASLVWALRQPRFGRLSVLALSHAVALFTYYLAPFIVAANAVVALSQRRAGRRPLAAIIVGSILGSPALLLGLLTLRRDYGAREAARSFPTLAWGDHTPMQLAAHMGHIAADAFGEPFLFLMLMATFVGLRRRNMAILTAAIGSVATFTAIALLSPIARVQAYYVTSVLPLAALTLATLPQPASDQGRRVRLAGMITLLAFSTAPLLAAARNLYLPSADAFMPRFAQAIARRPETKVVTVAHYDSTLLAYYLAQTYGRVIDWDSIDNASPKSIEPLIMVHALDANSEELGTRRLQEIIAAGPTLVVDRDAVVLPSIAAELASCELLLAAPTARLLRCAPRISLHANTPSS